MIGIPSARGIARSSPAHTRRRVVSAGVSFSAVVLLLVGLGTAPAAATNPTFPTWADVLRAEHNAAAKKAEIAKITALISGLQAQSASAGKLALEAGEAYDQAKASLDAATTTANRLELQASAAKKRAKKSSRIAGQLAAQLAREGYGNISLDLFLNGRKASDLLDVLGTMSKLSATSAELFSRAEQDSKTSSALGAQASVAKAARSKKAVAAQAAFTTASDEAKAAEGNVNYQSKQEKVLVAQLSSLTGTSASVLAQYYAGVAWEKKQAAQKTPPKNENPPGPIPGLPSGSAVAAAIAFARAQLGKPYQLGGSGPASYDCSGLTKAAYAAAGVYIGTHSATNQYSTMAAENRLVPFADRQPGDLLWYSDGGSPSATKYHVTLYIGNGEMIEAPYPGVTVRIAAVRYGDLVPFAGRPTG
ncbi:MAG TPA: NlpC/P60 family protein [Galbitalea sp.]|jgi:cell wall-associated NlpC family hydrolase|nr:NlpC/P60 family protein [Galbitalea sp.]